MPGDPPPSLMASITAFHQIPNSFLSDVKLEYANQALVFRWRHLKMTLPIQKIIDIRVRQKPMQHTLWFSYHHQDDLCWIGLVRNTPLFDPQKFLKKVIGKDFETLQKAWSKFTFQEDREVTVGRVPRPGLEPLKQIVQPEMTSGETVAAVATSDLGGVVVTTRQLYLIEALPGNRSGVSHRSRLQPLQVTSLQNLHLQHGVLTLTLKGPYGPETLTVCGCDHHASELVRHLNSQRDHHHMALWKQRLAASPKDTLEILSMTLLLATGLVCAPAYPREVLWGVAAVCGGAFLISLLQNWKMLLVGLVIALVGLVAPPIMAFLAILGVWGLMGRLVFIVEHHRAIIMSVPYFVLLGLLIYLNWHHPGSLNWSFPVLLWGMVSFVASGGMLVYMHEGTTRSRWHDLYAFILTPAVVISLLIPLLGKAMHAAPVHHVHAPHLPASHGHSGAGVHAAHMHTVSAHLRHTAHGPVLVREHLAADPYSKGS